MIIKNEKSCLPVGMVKMRNFIILLIIFTAISFLGGCVEKQGQVDSAITPIVSINNIDIPVEVVDTVKTRRLGLSYREELAKNSGMLFDMKNRRTVSFWMKDMNFPLDIIWIDGDKIVNISQDLPPAGSHPDITYSSEFPVDYVLEVNGGFCEKNNINIEDKVVFDINK